MFVLSSFFKVNFYLIGLKLILFLADIVSIFSGSTNETTRLLQVSEHLKCLYSVRVERSDKPRLNRVLTGN